MKKLLLIPLLLSSLGLGCQQPQPAATPTYVEPITFTIYTYASLADKDYGLLPKIIPQFERDHQVTVNLVAFPDTGSMLNQLILEKNNPKADVVMGLDNLDVLKANEAKVLTGFTPFDYGYVGFVYDSEKIQFPEPISLMDLASDTYKGKIIIEQPGLSSPGSQLLAWSYQALGDDLANTWWKNLADNKVLVAPDWSTAYYTMFLKEEAPIILSYLTSPAYHIDQEGTERYKTIPIKEGYIKQTEGVAIVQGSQATNVAQQFINYVISPVVQQQIATTQWMWPVDNAVQLPDAYNKIVTPTANQILPVITYAEPFNQWLDRWNTTFKIN